MKINVLNITGEKVKDHTLSKEVFGIEPNDAVLYDSIILTRNSLRQGTHSTKTRAEVSGGGRKPWKQKGTGRARQGSIRSPQWVGGGIVFGPTPRSYGKKMNRKERRLALRSALAYKAQSKELIVLESFVPETTKTKDMLATLSNLKADKNILIVVTELNDNLVLATRNITNVVLLQLDEVSTLDIVKADSLIITEDALKAVEEVLI
jgi:large subunit ribosomal protein L4